MFIASRSCWPRPTLRVTAARQTLCYHDRRGPGPRSSNPGPLDGLKSENVHLLSGTVWLRYSFEPDTGRFRRHFVSAGRHDAQAISGVGTIERTREHGRTFFTLYLFRGALTFQAGREAWDFNDESISFRFEGGARAIGHRFSVLKDGQDVWSCSYMSPMRAFFALTDPTYDYMDFESDHLLLMVANRGKDSGDRSAYSWLDEEPPNSGLETDEVPAHSSHRGRAGRGPRSA